jgi:1-acyl-sn-glycerol-3-phosphate acyltransferase
MDPFLLLAELPAKPFYYVLGDARTLYNKRWKRWILRLASGIIPLERRWREENAVLAATNRPDLAELAAAIEEHVPTGSSIQALRQLDQVMQALLSAGHGILLFPEGRLGTQEASLHTPLKRGTVNYALRAKVPIVPAVLIGTRDLYFRKQVILRFGPPLQFDPNQRFNRELSQTATEALEKALLEMLPVTYEDPAEPKPLGQWLNRLFW